MEKLSYFTAREISLSIYSCQLAKHTNVKGSTSCYFAYIHEIAINLKCEQHMDKQSVLNLRYFWISRYTYIK